LWYLAQCTHVKSIFSSVDGAGADGAAGVAGAVFRDTDTEAYGQKHYISTFLLSLAYMYVNFAYHIDTCPPVQCLQT